MTNPKLVIGLLLALAASVLVLGVLSSGPDPVPAPGGNGTGMAGRPAPASGGNSWDAPATVLAGDEPEAPRRNRVVPTARDTNVLLRLLSMEDSRARQAYLDKVAPALAALGPDEALAKVKELEDAELRDMAMLALLQEWSGVSTLDLVRSGEIWRYGAAGALASHLLNSGEFTAAQAADLALTGADGRRRADLLARIGAQLATQDPARALSLAEALEGRQQEQFFSRMAANLAASSPQAARQVASAIADPARRSAMMARILEAEAASNPVQAAQNFMLMPPETADAQVRAARRIAEAWAGRDTLAAMQWAGSLADANARAAAQQGINTAAPIGIGARVATGEGGVPVLRDIVPGGPASASGQLRAGDAVLAVSDGSGGWVSSQGMGVNQIVGLIRGDPNTRVSLQVQSPGEAVPRVVTLDRQQVIHRSQ